MAALRESTIIQVQHIFCFRVALAFMMIAYILVPGVAAPHVNQHWKNLSQFIRLSLLDPIRQTTCALAASGITRIGGTATL